MLLFVRRGSLPRGCCRSHCCRFFLRLSKNTQKLALKFRVFDGENGAAGVEDEIESSGKELSALAQQIAHAAFDAIALVGGADDFTDGESDAGCGDRVRLWSEKPACGCGLEFARDLVGGLIIGMTAKTKSGERCSAWSGLRHGNWRNESKPSVRLWRLHWVLWS